MAGALLNYNGSALMTPTGAYAINNLTPENIKSGVQIGGIIGNYTGSGHQVLTGRFTTSTTQYLSSWNNTTPATLFSGLPSKPTAFMFVRTVNESSYSYSPLGYYANIILSQGFNNEYGMILARNNTTGGYTFQLTESEVTFEDGDLKILSSRTDVGIILKGTYDYTIVL